MGELRRRVLDDRDLPFRDVAGGELPLGETEVAGTTGGQHSAEPRLLPQPRQRAVGVGRMNGESVEVSAGAAGSAQAHIQHLIAPFGQQLRHPVQRRAAAVRAAKQHQRGLVDVGRVKAVRQQRHTVAGRDHQVAFNPHRMRAAGPYAEHSAQKAHRLVRSRDAASPAGRMTAPKSRSTVKKLLVCSGDGAVWGR